MFYLIFSDQFCVSEHLLFRNSYSEQLSCTVISISVLSIWNLFCWSFFIKRWEMHLCIKCRNCKKKLAIPNKTHLFTNNKVACMKRKRLQSQNIQQRAPLSPIPISTKRTWEKKKNEDMRKNGVPHRKQEKK